MTAAVVALVMSAIELVEVWTGWGLGSMIDAKWVETLMFVLTPLLVWLVPGWANVNTR